MSGRSKKINLLVGSDIVAHREMCDIVHYMVQRGFEPVLYYPKHLPSANANARQDFFKDYAYVERLILGETVYPFLEADPYPDAVYKTPDEICTMYGLKKQPIFVEDINDPKFIARISRDPSVVGSISLRCTQMFKSEITQALKADGRFLLNLHSGILPEFRGLYSTPRAIAEMLKFPESSKGEFGCTLHHVDPFMPAQGSDMDKYNGIDTGNVVDIRTKKIDPDKTVYATNIELSVLGARAVQSTIDKITGVESLTGHPQNNSLGRYYSYAAASEIAEWQSLGVRMFDQEEVIETLVRTFSEEGSMHAMRFERKLREAMNQHFNTQSVPTNNTPNPAASVQSSQRRTHARGPFVEAVGGKARSLSAKVTQRNKRSGPGGALLPV